MVFQRFRCILAVLAQCGSSSWSLAISNLIWYLVVVMVLVVGDHPVGHHVGHLVHLDIGHNAHLHVGDHVGHLL